jgi:hypothetical protein
VDVAWRSVLEGGLLEARVGNVSVVRWVFKYDTLFCGGKLLRLFCGVVYSLSLLSVFMHI